ncbi:hypothetical protein C1645_831360 [Glomus cerebriforme]|uniref:Uncharacterized protein n=1 Tax=Glomus cerebriforme TaxID=658196 RepID=A0A397SFP4_9GLOM|nr:hypothetical protein C1645_831360 [Glomus cerebriforme]
MFYSLPERKQKDNLLNSTKWSDCEYYDYCKNQKFENGNLQISNFFEQRIDRKFEQNHQTTTPNSSITQLKSVISFLNTLNYNYSSLQQQIRKRQQQEKFKQRRKFIGNENDFNIIKDENNFANNLQQFITVYNRT